jgi:hypothetical protein
VQAKQLQAKPPHAKQQQGQHVAARPQSSRPTRVTEAAPIPPAPAPLVDQFGRPRTANEYGDF